MIGRDDAGTSEFSFPGAVPLGLEGATPAEGGAYRALCPATPGALAVQRALAVLAAQRAQAALR